MYRFITKSSPIIRQTSSRIARQYSTRSSANSNVNTKYLVGVLVPTILHSDTSHNPLIQFKMHLLLIVLEKILLKVML